MIDQTKLTASEIKEIQKRDWAESQSNDAFLHAEAEKEPEPKE